VLNVYTLRHIVRDMVFNFSQLTSDDIKLSNFIFTIYLMEALWLSFCLYLEPRHMMPVRMMTVFVRYCFTRVLVSCC